MATAIRSGHHSAFFSDPFYGWDASWFYTFNITTTSILAFSFFIRETYKGRDCTILIISSLDMSVIGTTRGIRAQAFYHTISILTWAPVPFRASYIFALLRKVRSFLVGNWLFLHADFANFAASVFTGVASAFTLMQFERTMTTSFDDGFTSGFIVDAKGNSLHDTQTFSNSADQDVRFRKVKRTGDRNGFLAFRLYSMAGTGSFRFFFRTFQGAFCRINGGNANRTIRYAIVFVIEQAFCDSSIIDRYSFRVLIRHAYRFTFQTFGNGCITVRICVCTYQSVGERSACSKRVSASGAVCRAWTVASPPGPDLQTFLSLVAP